MSSSASAPAQHPRQMKFIVVTGGVVSGLGKGITISSIGVLLKAMGIRVTAIKIDPYLNTDAGTMSPFEHGEVFVLSDGGEVDLDLGNYERFLNIRLTRDHNITTGKVNNQDNRRERRGDYLGKTVQVVPHVTDAIQVSRRASEPLPLTTRAGRARRSGLSACRASPRTTFPARPTCAWSRWAARWATLSRPSFWRRSASSSSAWVGWPRAVRVEQAGVRCG
jgi:hypothetical protein